MTCLCSGWVDGSVCPLEGASCPIDERAETKSIWPARHEDTGRSMPRTGSGDGSVCTVRWLRSPGLRPARCAPSSTWGMSAGRPPASWHLRGLTPGQDVTLATGGCPPAHLQAYPRREITMARWSLASAAKHTVRLISRPLLRSGGGVVAAEHAIGRA